MENIINLFFNFEVMQKTLHSLLLGLATTIKISVVVVVIGLVLGLIVSLANTSRHKWLQIITVIYVDIFRSIPPLVLLTFIYSGLPFIGIRPSPYQAVLLAFAFNNSAYYSEIYRAGLLSIAKGQFEAASSTGLTKAQTMIYVVLPQAIRNVLPDLLSNTVEVIKLSSLAYIVSLAELLYRADMARSVTYNSSPLILAAFIYLIILWPMVRLVSRFQKKFIV